MPTLQYILGLLNGIVTSIAGSAMYDFLRQQRRDSDIEKFWHFVHDEVYIVQPSYSYPGAEAMQSMARIEDVLAIDAIVRMLNKRKIRYRVLDHTAAIPDDVDVILLCSPKGNKLSAQFQSNHQMAYTFNIDDDGIQYIQDRFNNVKYYSPKDTGAGQKDIALVARCTSQCGQKLFLAWGIHGVGTLGTIKCVLDNKQLSLLNKASGGTDFAVLVECEYASIREIQNWRILGQPRMDVSVPTAVSSTVA